MADQPTEASRYQTYWVHPDHLGSSSGSREASTGRIFINNAAVK